MSRSPVTTSSLESSTTLLSTNSFTTADDGFQGKNLVLCFDGTGSKFGERPPSNVLRLYQMIERTDNTQIHYYQPGIGTYIGSDNDFDCVSSKWRTLLLHLDAIIAYSFDDHIVAGYRFLIRYYNAGDRIWMFGFSRGAFTARILASMIERVGLVGSGGEELVPCAWEIYKNWENHGQPSNPFCRASLLADRFKNTFSTSVPEIHFLGLWDSINSVGLIRNRIFPLTSRARIVKHLRHAISVDERRSKFKQNLYHGNAHAYSLLQMPDTNDIVERWFPGNHGDVGGGWPIDKETNAELTDVSLRWMIHEARDLGLNFSEEAVRALALRGSVSAIMSRAHDMLSFDSEVGKSRHAWLRWWVLELLPLPYMVDMRETGVWETRYLPNLGRRREVPRDAVMHWSVKWKQVLDKRYKPKNIPSTVTYEPDDTERMPDDLLSVAVSF
ncbi:hypothetical protein V1509DRAFT_617281 [Lipomyces kononenkoae]